MAGNTQFHSVLTANLPSSGTVGDVWYTTDTKLLYAVVGDGSLVQLLVSTPIPVVGPQGPQGIPGPQGAQGPTLQYAGNWSAAVEYATGTIVNANNSLYLSNAQTINNFPPGSPFWVLLGSVNATASEIVAVISGTGQSPLPGFVSYFSFPSDCVISGWVLLADVSGSASFDLKWSTFAALPSTVSIVAGAGPALVSQQKAEGDATGWSPTQFHAGDVLEIDLISCSGCTFLTLMVLVTKS